MGDYLHRDASTPDRAAVSAHYLAQLERAREMMTTTPEWAGEQETGER